MRTGWIPHARDLFPLGGIDGRETRVAIVHSTTEGLYEALKEAGRQSPVVEGELQRVFTGCYTSLARVKRQAVKSLAGLVQAEALRTAGHDPKDITALAHQPDSYVIDNLGSVRCPLVHVIGSRDRRVVLGNTHRGVE